MSESGAATDTSTAAKKWKPLGSTERRVLGTLIEKAKTTDSYPMTLNALVNGCNQKSNRDPQMSLEPHQVEDSLEKLRAINAVAEVQGDGRVAKYRHYGYDWLDVDKHEIAVMAELLLRGAQTLGELRGRAARMEAIADISALRPVVDSLIQKDLIVSLTPAGRGQIVTHNLYLPEQLEKVKQSVAPGGKSVPSSSASSSSASAPAPAASAPSSSPSEVAELRSEVNELKSELSRLKSEVEDLWQTVRG